MERTCLKIGKTLLAALLAAALSLPVMGGISKQAWANEPETVASGSRSFDGTLSDRPAALPTGALPLAGEPTTRANEDVTLSIKAGAATPVEGLANTYCFPDLKVSTIPEDAKFQSITVQFTTGIAAGDDIYYNSQHQKNESETLPAGFTRFPGNKTGNRSVNYTVAGGATAEQWEEFLSTYLTLSLADATNTKGLRLVASLAPVTTTRDYNSLNGHYYEVGTGSIGWLGALQEAEKHTYMGMRGYLVTVTSREEQDFVFSLVHTDTWIGGTCDDTHTRRNSDWAQNYRTNNADKSTRWSDVQTYNAGGYSHYYWVTGPEAGLKMGECRSNTERRTVVNPETNENMFMFWASAQPDGYSTGERWMQLAVNFGSTAADRLGEWNDLPRDYGSVNYYVIEYGGMPDDVDPDDADAGVDVSLDVYVKVDIIVDPTGRTITTEAEDVTVGEPLAIQENVNGDTEVKTHVFDSDNHEVATKDAVLTRTYKVKDPGAEGANAQGWRDLRPEEMNAKGEPFHAGSYKVVSTGTYSQRESGDLIQEYVAGEATFSIRPKPLDVTDTATKPSDPSVPDATQGFTATDPATGDVVEVTGRAWAKVYDGSPYLAGGNVSVAEGLLAGAEAWLSYDRAEFAQSDAGTWDLVLHGAVVKGANAGDYRLAGVASDGTLTVQGVIAPRDLKIASRWFQTMGTDPSSWVKNVPLADPSGAPAGVYTDARAFDASAATESASDGTNAWPVAWPENMLAPGDAVDDVLGETTFSPATAGGLALNKEHPQLGTYRLGFGFSKVATDGSSLTADGNYRVTLSPASLVVTERRTVDLTEGDPIEVVEPVRPAKPMPAPVTKDDLVDIAEDTYGPDAPAPSGGRIPDGVDPVVTIKKGGVPVDEIDPSDPGEYEVVVTYPDPDGTDYVVKIDYVVEKDPIASPQPGVFTVFTKLKGEIAGATISPTQSLGVGAFAIVNWSAGADCYVASVEVDGRMVDATSASWRFDNLDASHEVVVTLAKNPIIAGSATGGFYTVTVNRYGTGATVSPTAVLVAGANGHASWTPLEGHRITAVWVDGQRLADDAVAAGSIEFSDISANHVVDVYTEQVGGGSLLRADDARVTTSIKGGPGTITGGATVTLGGDYRVAWAPTVQTTPDVSDPSYAVYEVESIEVNGAPAAGVGERELTLSDIREDKDVVVSLRPVLYDVAVLAYGPGDASASRTLFKGQSYADIAGAPQTGAHVSYIEVDGACVFDERASRTTSLSDATASAVLQTIASEAVASAEDLCGIDDAMNGKDDGPEAGDAAEEGESSELVDEESPEPEEGKIEGDEGTQEEGSESYPAEEAETPGATDAAEESDPDSEASAVLEALGLAPEKAWADDGATPRAAAVFPASSVSTRQADRDGLDMGIAGIDADHKIKVYFAADGETANPDNVHDVDVTTGVEGGPGTVTVGDGTGFVDPSDDQKVTWQIPDGYEPIEVVVGDTRFPVPPGATEVVIPGGTLQPGDHAELVVEKRAPGDETVPSRTVSSADDRERFTIQTSITGGVGTISAGAVVRLGDSYEVQWAPGEAGGVRYRVAKVLIDGKERPDLLEAGRFVFEAIEGDHDIEVVLEALPSDAVKDGTETKGEDQGAGAGNSQGDGKDTGSKSGDSSGDQDALSRLAQTGDQLIARIAVLAMVAVISAAVLALARARRRNSQLRR